MKGTIYAECNRCSDKRFYGRYEWQSGRARCPSCGGSLEQIQAPPREKKQEQSTTSDGMNSPQS